MFVILGFFILGIISDIFIVIYTQAIIKRRAVMAMVYAVFITLLVYGVLAETLATNNKLYILAFSLGNGIGTFVSVKFDKKR